ncbi:MAG TPA: hypothetical protein VLJ59_08550 [Mycobacteriales bacterium]|nr:hypothetical protein [Mycobacteriales bacterium]
MDVEQRQRVTTLEGEYDITSPERIERKFELETDWLDFCFQPKPYYFNSPVRCFVQLYEVRDDAQGPEFLNGVGHVDLPENSSDPVWLSFSGFGYEDGAMTTPVRSCWAAIWLEGNGSSRVAVYI